MAWSRLTGQKPGEIFTALPMVGEGHSYQKAQIPLIGPRKLMPSGGFNNQDWRQLWRDLRGGLGQLTWGQIEQVRQWGQTGGKILAVGDIVPLALGWMGGGHYAFVGTAKSEYYLRSPEGNWLETTPSWEKLLGSAYYPWERWLMTRPGCQAVFPRDTLTHEILRNQGVPSQNLGNPMMDGLDPAPLTLPPELTENPLKLLLLPGSRLPEALHNWQLILNSLPRVYSAFPDRAVISWVAIAPALSLTHFKEQIDQDFWKVNLSNSSDFFQTFTHGSHQLWLSNQGFTSALHWAQGAIALAGTATEQCTGLGKPVITLAGNGPQFTPAFARRQTWLLGPSVQFVPSPDAVGPALAACLKDAEKLTAIAHNGRERMGLPGASDRIAQALINVWG